MARVNLRATANQSHPGTAARRASSRRWNGWNTLPRSSAPMPFPRSTTRQHVVADDPGLDADRTGASAVVMRCRRGWRRRAEQGRVRENRRCALRHIDDDVTGARPQARERCGDDLVERRRSQRRHHCVRLDAGHVEQVVHEVREAIGLILDGGEELRGFVRSPLDVRLAKAVDRGLDASQWCAEVVRDGNNALPHSFASASALASAAVHSAVVDRGPPTGSTRTLSIRRSSVARSPPESANMSSEPTACTSSAFAGLVTLVPSAASTAHPPSVRGAGATPERPNDLPQVRHHRRERVRVDDAARAEPTGSPPPLSTGGLGGPPRRERDEPADDHGGDQVHTERASRFRRRRPSTCEWAA